MDLSVANLPSQRLAFSNCVYVSDADYAQLRSVVEVLDADADRFGVMVELNGRFTFAARPLGSIEPGALAMNGLQRRFCQFTLNQALRVTAAPAAVPLATLELQLAVLGRARSEGKRPEIDQDDLNQHMLNTFEQQAFEPGQLFAISFNGMNFSVTVLQALQIDAGAGVTPDGARGGALLDMTEVQWRKAEGAAFTLTGGGSSTQANAVFRPDFDFNKLGIGGLDDEFASIFRRAFASRVFPTAVVKRMGLNHVRGILLFGPPGCGKTLIARQIGKILNSHEPIIVNGPEVLNKYVGASEEKIRELFAPAEAEQEEMGDQSQLHVIIMDEMDAICKKRGTVRDGTGVGDSVVNQLLSKIDGVNSLHNVLLIGMTNRKDMIDEALLRPGRLEVHVEIGLPTAEGRKQILGIHTAPMRESNYLDADVEANMDELARRTKNFTGAEIEGLVRCAASYAFNRQVDMNNLDNVDPDAFRLTMPDMDMALGEIHPKFGTDTAELEASFRNGIVNYGPAYEQLRSTLDQLAEQVQTSARTPLMSVLLEGATGTGKTALAAKLAHDSGFPFVRVISPDALIGYSESSKCAELARVFDEAYKSPLSMIILDDIERLIDFVPVGMRFSNTVLQALLMLCKKAPPVEGRKLMVVGTTSCADLLRDLQLVQAFNLALRVPQLTQPDEVAAVLADAVPVEDQSSIRSIAHSLTEPVSIKTLLMVIEMAREEDTGEVRPERFQECASRAGVH